MAFGSGRVGSVEDFKRLASQTQRLEASNLPGSESDRFNP